MPSEPIRPASTVQTGTANLASVIALGEVLWDLFEDGRRLGGAPLNFAAHIRRLGHPVCLISAVGADEPGGEAAARIARLDLDCRYLEISARFATGTATVELGTDGSPDFSITRPAAYDDIDLAPRTLQAIAESAPAWFYFGSLYAATDTGRRAFDQLCEALQQSLKFIDLNLRPGFDAPTLVMELLVRADVVKLNEPELERVCELSGLPGATEAFCHAAADYFGWRAIAITLGARGCALWSDGSYTEAAASPVAVVDTVGTGDAFAAGCLHGLSQSWPADRIAAFANRLAAGVAGHAGALPDMLVDRAVP
jgi:fructokinase